MSYSRLTNVVPKVEGQLETRDGLTLIEQVLASSEVHTIFRLNQEVASLNTERLIGVGTAFHTALIGGSFAAQTGITFDGNPLTIISFRFTDDPATWAIIANANGMRKYRESKYFALGNIAPLTAATATDAGAGNLDSDGGIPYDWRYNNVNEDTNTWSNPSPEAMDTAIETRRPTAFTNPDPDLPLDNPFTNPGNAFDGNTLTSADSGLTPGGRSSCRWITWTAASAAYATLRLIVLSEITGGSGNASIQYSTDGGTSWKTLVGSFTTRLKQEDTATLNPAQDLNQLLVRSVNLVPPQKVKIYDIRTEADLQSSSGSKLTLSGGRQANVCVDAPTDAQHTAVDLYRRGGSLVSNWFFQGRHQTLGLVQGGCAVGELEINDNRSDTAISTAKTLELDNDVPVSSVETTAVPLPAIWGPYDERTLGCGDANRPESVYFSKRGNADAWPPQNHVEVSAPGEAMMNGIVYATRTYAFSTERMYQLVPHLIQGATFTPFETDCRRGLISRWALTTGRLGIYFVSKDGVYVTKGGAEESIIDPNLSPLFPTQQGPGRDVGDVEAPDMTSPDDIRLEWHNGEVWFVYKGATSATKQTLIFDEKLARWRRESYTPEVSIVHSERGTTSSLLVGDTDGNLYTAGGTSDNGTDITTTLRTGSFDMDAPLNLKEYGTVIFDLNPGGATTALPITITPHINGEASTQAALTITGTGRQRVPLDLSDVAAYNLQFEVTWTRSSTIAPVLFQFELLWRMEPIPIRHWEHPGSTFGVPGWMHIRDAYVTLRSSADVTLTVTPDNGSAMPFTLKSTAGAKKKVYVPFPFNKAKVYQWEFNSTADFRIYDDESETRVKPWLTKLGYAVVPAFGGQDRQTSQAR